MPALLTVAIDLLKNGSAALFACTLFHLGLLLVCLVLGVFDSRLVMGVGPWLKPAKFCLSIALYCATLSVLLGLLDGFVSTRLWIGRAVTALMLVETACLMLQASRGVTSHYNISTPFDSGIFAAMGIAIALNTILDAVVFGLFVYSPDPHLGTGLLWGIRFGLILFIGAAMEGGVMIMNQAHTVGAPDGGPGLPVLNWSTSSGDLRVAHFLGLHAIQILPLAGLLADRIPLPGSGAIAVSLLSAGYGWLMWWQTKLALAGRVFFKL